MLIKSSHPGHESLRNPRPCEIRKGLKPVPLLDVELASTLQQPFIDVGVTADGVEVMSTGLHGGLVNREDFEAWLTAAHADLDAESGSEVSNTCIEWAVGLLWPDRSFANMRKHRCPKRVVWNAYHHGRMDMLAGDCTVKLIYFPC